MLLACYIATVALCERVFRGRGRGGGGKDEYTNELGVIDHVKNFGEVKTYIKSIFFIHTGLFIVLFEIYVWKSQSLGFLNVIFFLSITFVYGRKSEQEKKFVLLLFLQCVKKLRWIQIGTYMYEFQIVLK